VTARLASLSNRAQVAVVATVLLLVAVIGYFALISPKHSTAASLKKQTAAVQAQIEANRSTAFTQALPAVRAASVFRLAMAMPNRLQTPDIILQLNALAEDSGISFDQIQPGIAGGTGTTTGTAGAPVAATSDTTAPFAAEPIQVKFTGSFYNLLAFLQRLRNLVRVENGRLFTAGRLFDVSDLQFCPVGSAVCSSGQGQQQQASGIPKLSRITATITINEFVPQTAQAATSTTSAGSTTGTTSTTTTGTTTTSNGTSAAPSTSGGTS
jgi:Tfp pilus assembly protein PilO